jgi:hypothetical protein
MSTPSARALLRLFSMAFVLLLGSGTNGRARVSVHTHRSSRQIMAAANVRAALPTSHVQKDVETTPPTLLASEASPPDGHVQPTPAPAREFSSLCSCERTTGQAARPPPFQA